MRADQCHAAAGKDAFLDCRLGGVERVVNAVLRLLHFHFGGAAGTLARVAVLVFVALFLIGIALAYGGVALAPGPAPS